jgi:7-cyano-7-deazaguanine synthase
MSLAEKKAELEKEFADKGIKKVVISLSGGLDSTILTYLMVSILGKKNVYCISAGYNQRHDVELILARKTTALLGVSHKVIDISFMGEIAAGVSSMVKGDVATPTMEDVLGEPQPSTYMPNRNMILAAIVAGYAESVGANAIALGIQKIDSYSYWDTTPAFYDAVGEVLKLNRKNTIHFVAPFLNSSKIGEIQLAQELAVPLGDTWTCYNPSSEMLSSGSDEDMVETKIKYTICGVCPSCSERAAAFAKAGIIDPVEMLGVIV